MCKYGTTCAIKKGNTLRWLPEMITYHVAISWRCLWGIMCARIFIEVSMHVWICVWYCSVFWKEKSHYQYRFVTLNGYRWYIITRVLKLQRMPFEIVFSYFLQSIFAPRCGHPCVPDSFWFALTCLANRGTQWHNKPVRDRAVYYGLWCNRQQHLVGYCGRVPSPYFFLSKRGASSSAQAQHGLRRRLNAKRSKIARKSRHPVPHSPRLVLTWSETAPTGGAARTQHAWKLAHGRARQLED
jgi:hypothetical protein